VSTKLLSSIIIVLLGCLGFAFFSVLQNKSESNASVQEDSVVLGGKKPDTEERPPKPQASTLVFTNAENKEVGRLIIGDVITFSGELDTSGLIFASYVANQLTVNCEKLKIGSPISLSKPPESSSPPAEASVPSKKK